MLQMTINSMLEKGKYKVLESLKVSVKIEWIGENCNVWLILVYGCHNPRNIQNSSYGCIIWYKKWYELVNCENYKKSGTHSMKMMCFRIWATEWNNEI